MTNHPKKLKAPSLTQWHAFTINKMSQNPEVLTAKTQKELKDLLKKNQDNELIALVKGRSFQFKIQRSFEFIKQGEEIESLALEN